MDWEKLKIFHVVAEAGSFTHAGEALNLSQSAVSRQISALEQELKVPLFHRHARGLLLTAQGSLPHGARSIHEAGSDALAAFRQPRKAERRVESDDRRRARQLLAGVA